MTTYIGGPYATTVTPRSGASPFTEVLSPPTLLSFPTVLSSTSGHSLAGDGPRDEKAVEVSSNKGPVSEDSGHNLDRAPIAPYFFIPLFIIAVVFSFMVEERRIRGVVGEVMGNIAMDRQRRRARRL